MSAAKIHRQLWFTRRDSVVRGPYPENQISRYVLLGRIRESDELRAEGGAWQPLSAYPELIPEVMKLPPSDESRQQLLMARMREDERQPGDRRERGPRPSDEILERRTGTDRRRPEQVEVLRHRNLRYRVSHDKQVKMPLYRYPLIASVIVLVGFSMSYLMGRLEPESVPPNCAAKPRPGVNWDNCNQVGLVANNADLVGANISNARLDAAQLSGANLAGADLKYTSANMGNLHKADLSHASLVGATLRNADLSGSQLTRADLSYANLSGADIRGANLEGAILDNTIWIDQRPCMPGSVGVCKRLRQASNRAQEPLD
jgi:hypothetical protein